MATRRQQDYRRPPHFSASNRSYTPRYREEQPKKSVAGPIIFMVLLVVVIGACIFFVGPKLFGSKPQQANSNQQQAESASAENQTTETPAAQPAPANQSQVWGTASDPRNTEFAVDPTRTTWNLTNPVPMTVYLTFDDGPSANTQTVLDVLDRYGIKATFFVTNINPEYIPMIAECYKRGHTIGMHTYSHDYEQVYASKEAYWNDLNAIAEIVRGQIGYVPCFIRFPGGSSNTISRNYTPGIMTELAQEVQAAGYQYYDWDASCGDGATHTAEELQEATWWDTQYGYQSIVFLMHDGAGKETTAEALPNIIEYFMAQGYSFSAIDRQTQVPHHGIGN